MARRATTTLGIKATLTDGISGPFKAIATAMKKGAADMVKADKKVKASSETAEKAAADARHEKTKGISASKRISLALKDEAAAGNKTAKSLAALDRELAQNHALLRKSAAGGRQVSAGLIRQNLALKKQKAALIATQQRWTKMSKVAKGAALATFAAGALGAVLVLRKLGRVLVESVKKAAEFETAIAEVATITSNAPQHIENLKKVTKDFSIEFGTRAVDQVSAMYAAYSGSAKDSAAVVLSANRLAAAGIGLIPDATKVIIQAQRAWGEETLSAERAASVLFKTVQSGITTVPELSAAMGMVNQNAQAAGLSFAETASAVAAISTKAPTTAIAVTQLKSLLAAFTKDSKKATKEAKNLNVEWGVNAMKAAGGLLPFLQKIRKSHNLTEKSLTKILGRQEAVNAVLALTAENGQQFANTLKGMDSAAEDFDDAVKIMLSTTTSQTEQFVALKDAAKIGLGEAVTGSENAALGMQAINDALREMIGFFDSAEGRAAVNQFFGSMAGLVADAIVGMQALHGLFKGDWTLGGDPNSEAVEKLKQLSADTQAGAQELERLKQRLREEAAAIGPAPTESEAFQLKGLNELIARATAEQQKRIQVNAAAAQAIQKSIGTEVTALDKLAQRLREIADESERQANKTPAQLDAERKARIKAAKEREKIRAREAKARSAAARKRLEEEKKIAEEQKRLEGDKERRKKAKDDQEKLIAEYWAEKNKADSDRRIELDKKEQIIVKEWQREKDKLMKEKATEMEGYFRGAYDGIKNAAASTFGQVGQEVNGQMMTMGRATGEFFKNLGGQILSFALEKVSAIGMEMAAERVAAMFSLKTSAAEAAGKSMSAYAGIPFIGIGLGLAAAALAVSTIMGFANFHSGGLVQGPHGRDKVPIMAEAGEFVLPASLVEDIRRGKPPRTAGHFSTGGQVSQAQAVSSGNSVNVTLASNIPPDRARLKRMVRDVIMPELRQLRSAGVKI